MINNMNDRSLDPWWILHVDNDEEDYLLTREMLAQVQGRKIRLDWADNFDLAEMLLKRNQYSAVLVDYDLGEKTGIELIRRAVARRYAAPFILYTGRVGSEADMEAMEAGATLYMAKIETTPLLLERFIRYAIEHRRYEEEISCRLQERSDILESIQDGFFAIDRAWRLLYVNRRAASKGSVEPAQLVGQNLWEVYPELLGTRFESAYRKVMETGVPVQFEAQGVLTSTWYTVSVYPSREGISVYWQDITQRRRSEEALRQSEAVFSVVARNFPDGAIMVVDRSYRYIVVDGAALERLGYSQEMVEGKKVGEMTGEPYRSLLVEYFQRTLAGESQLYEMLFKGRWIRTQFIPLRGEQGEVIAGMVLLRDFTAQKQTERDLKACAARFESLLAYTRLDSRPILFSAVNLGSVAEEVLADLAAQVRETAGVVEIGNLPVIEADAALMRQLLLNLVDNALKFHAPGIPPRVKLTAQVSPEGMARLVVADHGIGFSDADAAELFQPFPLLAGGVAADGAGMGLAICRKIVERHGGAISAQGKPGAGAVFTVTLPREH